jgi:hypothetical protein
MSLTVQISVVDYTRAELERLGGALRDGKAMHTSIATDAERFVKKTGRQIADSVRNHRSANRLGARPTGHLGQAYAGIEGASTDDSASLLIPRASRLRAAFGRYTLTPGAGKKYLTIPVAAEAYGKRAGQFPDLQFMRVGLRKTPILARPGRDGSITTLYLLVTKAEIPEDRDIFPFQELENEARRAAGEYLDNALEATL